MHWKAYFRKGKSMYSTKGDLWEDVLKKLDDLTAVAYFIKDKMFIVRIKEKTIDVNHNAEGFVEISKCNVEIKDMKPILVAIGKDVNFGFDAKDTLSSKDVKRYLTIKEDGTHTVYEINNG